MTVSKSRSRAAVFRTWIGFLLLALALGSCKSSTLTSQQEREIREGVAAMLQEYGSYSSAGDTEALLALYLDAPGFVWAEDGSIRYRSVDEVRDGLGGLPPDMAVQTELDETTIRPVSPGAATVTTLFRTQVGSDSTGFSFSGVITMSVVRTAAGWRIASGHTSTAGGAGR